MLITPRKSSDLQERATLSSGIWLKLALIVLACGSSTGCYVPLHSPGTPACELPAYYRTPQRTDAPALTLTKLTVPEPAELRIAPNDKLLVTVPGLFEEQTVRPISVQVMMDGSVPLPIVEKVEVVGMNLAEAQSAINAAYEPEFQVKPRVSLELQEVDTVDVTVTGQVKNPGVHELPRTKNHIGHAVGLAGGLLEDAADTIEVHRRMVTGDVSEEVVLNIPLRGNGRPFLTGFDRSMLLDSITKNMIQLQSGDVIHVPQQRDETFFVVGPLSRTNVVNFSVRNKDRELGNAFLLPRDRDIDVVTAVAMAGYIDPIDSPSTVTVHRNKPGAPPQLITVDLIKARSDWNENLYIQPGDIVYLNPDAAWWFRRMFDRVAPALITEGANLRQR